MMRKILQWMRRPVKVVLTAFIVAYLALVAFVVVYQRHLLYLPQRFSLVAATSFASTNGLVPWANPAGEVIGWRLPAQTPAIGSVLIAHGNGGSALNMRGLGAALQAATGLDVYLLEYPGYGHRGGSPSETSLLAAADEAWEMLPTNRPAYVVSESLGTGVAAHLAQKYPAQVAGLLMFVPYDRLASVAQNHYPFLPANLLLWDRFAPVDWLANYRGAVKIVIAGQDEIIPPVRGMALFESYQGPKLLQIIPGSGHGGTTRQSPQWWRDVLAFWKNRGA